MGHWGNVSRRDAEDAEGREGEWSVGLREAQRSPLEGEASLSRTAHGAVLQGPSLSWPPASLPGRSRSSLATSRQHPKPLRLDRANESFRALLAPPSHNVCPGFSSCRTRSPAAQGGRGRARHGPLPACLAGAGVRWLQAGNTQNHCGWIVRMSPFGLSSHHPATMFARASLAVELVHLPHKAAGVVRPLPFAPYRRMITTPGSAPCHTIWL